jgi:hypothetical protein
MSQQKSLRRRLARSEAERTKKQGLKPIHFWRGYGTNKFVP